MQRQSKAEFAYVVQVYCGDPFFGASSSETCCELGIPEAWVSLRVLVERNKAFENLGVGLAGSQERR